VRFNPLEAEVLDRAEGLVVSACKAVFGPGHFRGFYEYISDWQRIRKDPECARQALKEGILALDEIARWRRNQLTLPSGIL